MSRLLASILIFCTLTPLAEAAETRRFPIKISEHKTLTVKVTAADKAEGEFILDTGAGLHVLSMALLEKLPARPIGKFTGFRHTGERVDLDLYRIPSLRIGNFVEKEPIVAGWDVLDKYKIDGVLSLKFFQNQPATIDFRNKQLIFEREEDLRRLARTGKVASLQVDDDRDVSLDIFVEMALGRGVTGQFTVDTGSDNMASVDARFMSALGLDKTAANVERTEGKNFLGETEVRYKATLDRFALADAPEIGMKAVVTFKEHMIYDGLLGVPFWLDKSLTIDIPRRRLIVN